MLFSSELYQEDTPWSTGNSSHSSGHGHTAQGDEEDAGSQGSSSGGHGHSRARPSRWDMPNWCGTNTGGRHNGLVRPGSSKDREEGGSGTAWAGGPQEEGPQGAGISPGHITNLARNSSGLVWSLSQLKERLGEAAWRGLWGAMESSVCAALRAARPSLLEAHAWLK